MQQGFVHTYPFAHGCKRLIFGNGNHSEVKILQLSVLIKRLNELINVLRFNFAPADIKAFQVRSILYKQAKVLNSLVSKFKLRDSKSV